jgi:hypothetical protein
MQIDWDKTLEDILADKMTCPRCGSFTAEIVAGYTRATWAAEFAPRCQFCTKKEECEARKLVVLCEGCAQELGLRARRVDQETVMTMLLDDCRKDLDECLEYLAEFWQEDLEVPLDEMDKRLDEYDPEVFAEEDEGRRRLEEEYLSYHRWFRDHGIRIPSPGWRAEYVEEIVALGYSSILGD